MSGHTGAFSVGHLHDGQPGRVGVEVAQGEPVGGGLAEAADVVFDKGVGANVAVGFDGPGFGGVGVVGQLAVALRREQALLEATESV